MKRRWPALEWAVPLRWRLVLAAVAVLAAVLAVFGSILYANLSSALLDTIANSLQTSAQTVIGQEVHESFVRTPPSPGNAPAFRPPPSAHRGLELLPPGTIQNDPFLFRRLALDLTNVDTSARVVDGYGQELAGRPDNGFLPSPPSPSLAASIYQAVAATQQPRSLSVGTPDGAVLVELIPLVQPADSGGQSVAILQLTTSLRLANTLLDRLRLLLVAGTLLAIAATAVLTALLVGAVLTPLRRMTATSRAITTGDLSRRVVVPKGGDELTALAVAFNAMVARLEALLVAQRRFIADASHELRTPLTALAGGMEMLLLSDDDAARARLARLMQGEIARMGRLVDGLLTLTRLDARGKSALSIHPVDVSALAAQVVDETRLLAPQGLDVDLDLPDPAPVVVPGDADRLHQVLLNLCTNARAHTPPPGTITVRVRRQGTYAQVQVADTGTGIETEDLPHVWDRLYRTDPSRKRQAGQGGLGLGLAIVRAIVESHGGTATIDSAIGKGTTVTVTLPGATTMAKAGQEALASSTAVRPGT